MELIDNFFTQENIDLIIDFVRSTGILGGVLMPIIEAFFPILPLVLFVTINITAFGFVKGYIYSWIGNCLGSFLLFLLIKKIDKSKIQSKIENSKIKNLLNKINNNDFTILFILYCFPFTPSFLISGSSALADVESKHFLAALIPSKLLMMFSLAFIGLNIRSFIQNPLRSAAFIGLVVVINYLGKRIIKYYESKLE